MSRGWAFLIGFGALAASSGCETSAGPCDPECGAGERCYYGVCIPEGDGGTNDGDVSVRDDAGRDDGTTDDGGVPVNGKLDLLFVVDNSASMGEEQRMLTSAFPALLRALVTPPLDPGTGDPLYPAIDDLRVAVVSTDLGTAPYTVPTCAGTDDGILLHEPSSEVAGCATTYPPFLTRSAVAPSPTMGQDFACIATLGTGGCGFEQPLAASERALVLQARPGGPNDGFLRADAMLGIVFLSDENDCSAADPALFDPVGDPPLPRRCVEMAHLLTPVSEIAASLRGVKPPGRIVMAMFVGVPVAMPLCNAGGDRIAACLAEATMTEEFINPSELRPVCQNTETKAVPGRRFLELAREFGAAAWVQSLCDPQFDTVFQRFAEMVQSRL